MKKMMNTLLSMLICTVLFSTCFGATTVCAAPSGKIEIQLKDLNTAHSNKTGVTFKLYLVGTVLDSGEPVIDPVYGITEYPVTADETEQAVKKIKAALTGSAQASATTDASGKAVLSGVADGIYYIAADESNGYGIVEPLLVQIPYSVEGTGEGNHLVWEVSESRRHLSGRQNQRNLLVIRNIPRVIILTMHSLIAGGRYNDRDQRSKNR